MLLKDGIGRCEDGCKILGCLHNVCTALHARWVEDAPAVTRRSNGGRVVHSPCDARQVLLQRRDQIHAQGIVLCEALGNWGRFVENRWGAAGFRRGAAGYRTGDRDYGTKCQKSCQYWPCMTRSAIHFLPAFFSHRRRALTECFHGCVTSEHGQNTPRPRSESPQDVREDRPKSRRM